MDAAIIALSLLASVFVFSVLSCILSLSWHLTSSTISLSVDAICAFDAIVALWSSRVDRSLGLRGSRISPAAGGFFVLALASLLFIWWHSTSPYPVTPGWDLQNVIVQVTFVQTHSGFAYLIMPAVGPSDFAYPALFMELLAGASLYTGLSPLQVFWWGPALLIAGYMLMVYGLALRFSGEWWLALIIAGIGGLIGVAEGDVVRIGLYLTVEMVAQVLFLAVLLWYSSTNASIVVRRIVVLGAGSFLGILYFFAMLPMAPLLGALLVASDTRQPLRGWRTFLALNLALVAGLAAFAWVPALSPGGLSQFIGSTEFPEAQKASVLLSIYPPPVLIPLFAALAVLLRRFRTLGRHPIGLPYFAVGALALFIGYWIPVWPSYRFELYVRSYLLVGLSGLSLLPLRSEHPARAQIRVARAPPGFAADGLTRDRVLATVLAIGLFVIPAAGLVPAYAGYIHGYTSYFSEDEYNMSAWIDAHLPANAYLATDPGSGYFFRGLAYRNASISFILPDGRAPVNLSTTDSPLNALLYAAFTAADAGLARAGFLRIGIPDLYVLVTTRTEVWLGSGGRLWSSHPVPATNLAPLLARFVWPYFTAVYASGDVYLFAV